MKDRRFKYINLGLAALWLCFVYVNLTVFFERPSLSTLLFMLAQSEFVVLLIIRKPAVLITKKWSDYFLAIAGTFIALLFQPAAGQFNYIGDILIYIGVVFEIVAFLYLNTSSGVIPANRGVKMRGPYRLVRHPIYASYMFIYAGYVLNNPLILNFCILVAAIVLQVWRISREEEVLRKDSSYGEYSSRVRWKLVPFLY